MKFHTRNLMLVAVAIVLASPQSIAAQPPPGLGDCMQCAFCSFLGGGDMCVGDYYGANNCSQGELWGECFCLPYAGVCDQTSASAEVEAAVKALTNTGTLQSDLPFYYAWQPDGDLLLKRKCDGVSVARLMHNGSRFALLELTVEFAVVAAAHDPNGLDQVLSN